MLPISVVAVLSTKGFVFAVIVSRSCCRPDRLFMSPENLSGFLSLFAPKYPIYSSKLPFIQINNLSIISFI